MGAYLLQASKAKGRPQTASLSFGSIYFLAAGFFAGAFFAAGFAAGLVAGFFAAGFAATLAAAGAGREANSSNAARGVSRASSETMSRPSQKLFHQPPTTRTLRSKEGIARPW